MILPGQLGGKVGRRRDITAKASRLWREAFRVLGGILVREPFACPWLVPQDTSSFPGPHGRKSLGIQVVA